MSIRILLTEIIKWKTSSKKKIINSSDNYHYHKLDIRKSEIVFTFCLKVHWRKSKLSHRGKKKDEQIKMENLHQILMKIKYFPKILPQLDDLSAEGNYVGEKNIKSQIMSQNT